MTYCNRRIFTEDEMVSAKAMRARGMSWRDLGAAFGCDYATVRRNIEPGYIAFRRKQLAKREGYRSTGPRQFVQSRLEIPEEVFAERDKRNAAPRSLTAILQGDPAPGQSALDKRGTA